jgi:methionyl-tRNA formyltransferase
MRLAVIGRTESLFQTAQMLRQAGHEIGLVITSKEAPEYTVTADDFARLADEIGAQFVRTAKVTPNMISDGLDLAVSVNCVSVLTREVIDRFRLGILNAHGGDLPRYRGNACQAWAIINAEPYIGLCIHKMVGGELDSGDIISEERHPVSIDTTIGEVTDWMNARIPPLMVEAVNKLSDDPSCILRRQSDDPRPPYRCYPRNSDDGRIDWRLSAEQIIRLVNASGRPYSGAFCYLEGEKLTIWSAALVNDGEEFAAVPGQITSLEKPIEIATGHGKIRVLNWDGPAPKSIRQRLS